MVELLLHALGEMVLNKGLGGFFFVFFFWLVGWFLKTEFINCIAVLPQLLLAVKVYATC